MLTTITNDFPQTQTRYIEPARELPVIAHADVVVVGGGPGGVAAALGAAKQGADTLLVERFGTFGGTWTSGILSTIMPFPFVKGFFSDIIDELSKRGGGFYPNKKTGIFRYDSECMKCVLDDLICQSGVSPLFFVNFCSAWVEGQRVKAIVVESKEGRGVITGNWFIDSSGDGDLCASANVPFEMGRDHDGALQPMTLIFKMDQVDTEKAMAVKKKDPGFTQALAQARSRGEITFEREEVLSSPLPKQGQWHCNTTRILNKDGTKIKDVSEAMIEGRRQANEVHQLLKKYVSGFENSVISETAPHIGVRETRRIQCDYTMTQNDIVQATSHPDSIAAGDWYIDIHSPDGAGTTRIRPPEGECYYIPYRSITPQGLDNTWVASRCIDCSFEAHAAIRITPQVFAIGQAAGTAAALCHREQIENSRQLDMALLKEQLVADGVYL